MIKCLIGLSNESVGVLLSEYLRLRGYECEWLQTPSEALTALGKRHFDFCIVEDDAELVRDIRNGSKVPVYALQNAFDKDAQLALYEAGADDCLVLPVVPDLMICKMEALRKRQDEYEQSLPHVFQYDGVYFDSVHQLLRVGNKEIHLSTKENDVLLLLCRQENEVVERSRILKTVWKSDTYFKGRSLSVYINRLRGYIEKDSTLRIVPMRGRGYKFLRNEHF